MLKCHKCVYKQTIPGNTHITCTNPDEKMTGNAYGIQRGWFFYPYIFDPTWGTKDCSNFKEKITYIVYR